MESKCGLENVRFISNSCLANFYSVNSTKLSRLSWYHGLSHWGNWGTFSEHWSEAKLHGQRVHSKNSCLQNFTPAFAGVITTQVNSFGSNAHNLCHVSLTWCHFSQAKLSKERYADMLIQSYHGLFKSLNLWRLTVPNESLDVSSNNAFGFSDFDKCINALLDLVGP